MSKFLKQISWILLHDYSFNEYKFKDDLTAYFKSLNYVDFFNGKIEEGILEHNFKTKQNIVTDCEHLIEYNML
jgi:hypothetical protein